MKIQDLRQRLIAAVAAAEAEATAAGEKLAALAAEQAACAAEIERLHMRSAALAAEIAAIGTTALTAAWMQRQSDLDSVDRTVDLMQAHGIEAVEPVVAAAPKAALAEGYAPPAFTAPEDDAPVESVTYPEAILRVLNRNPASAKQWSLAELATAVARVRGLPDSPLTRQRVSTAVERLVAQGQVRAKHSDARGKRVYSIH